MNLRKNFKFLFLMTFLTLTFSLTACSNSFTPAVMTTTKVENQKESAQEPIAETHTENNPGLPSDDPQPEQNLAEQDSPPTAKDTAWTSYTGIKAHIKETHGERFLISSDTDDFPGTFPDSYHDGSGEYFSRGRSNQAWLSGYCLYESTGRGSAKGAWH